MSNDKKPEIVQLLARINEGATNSQTSLSEVLRLCMRLGRVLKNQELSDWAKAESGGYDSIDNLPKYRIFRTEVRGTFSGPFGSGLENAPVPEAIIDKDLRNALCNVYMTQPVGELEQIVSRNEDSKRLTIPWPGDAILYYQQRSIYQGYVLTSAWKVMTTALIAGTLEVIRTRVLEFVLLIEKELGINVMDYDEAKKPETPAQERVHQIFNTTIHGGDNIALGNSGTTNQHAIHVQPGDLKGLKKKLAELGVTDELLKDLDMALDKDEDAEEQPGPHVQGWLTKVMIKAGKGTLQLASTAATTVVVAEVRRFLGLPPA